MISLVESTSNNETIGLTFFSLKSGQSAPGSVFSNVSEATANDSSSSSIVSSTDQLILTVFLAVIVFCGVVGNSLVVIIMLLSKEYRKTSTNTFVFNLAIADLLFIVCCAPFQGSIYILNEWVFGAVMCKLVHCLQYATMLASILILTFMSVERYSALTHPFFTKRWSTPKMANVIALIIWTVSFGTSAPWLNYYVLQEMEYKYRFLAFCYDTWEYHYMRKWFMLYFLLAGFFIPVLIVSTMSGLTIKTILEHSKTDFAMEGGRHRGGSFKRLKEQAIKRRRVTAIIFAVAILFFICWLPHNIIVLWINFFHFPYNKFTFIFRVFTHILTYLNSVINPFLYALVSDNFRRIFKKLLSHPIAEHRQRPLPVRNRKPGAAELGGSLLQASNGHSPSSLGALLRELSPLKNSFELNQYRAAVAPSPTPSPVGTVEPGKQVIQIHFNDSSKPVTNSEICVL